MTTTDTATVADELAILELIGMYCQCLDDGRFDELLTCFAPDAALVFGGDRTSGRDAIRDWLEVAQRAEARGKHLTSNAVMRIDGDTATSDTDWLFLVPGEAALVAAAVGRYRDRLQRVDGRWVFTEREIQPLAPPS